MALSCRPGIIWLYELELWVALVIDEKALGKRLQLARRRAGLTQQELCDKAELAYSTLAKIERGAIRAPSVFTVASIAEATGTSLVELVGGSDQKSPALSEPKKVSKSGVRFVYFDVSGVLVRFFHRAFTEISRETHKPADVIETLFWRYNDAACRGQMSLQQFDKTLGKELDIDDFHWQKYYIDNVEQMPGIGELVAWAAKHYLVGLITNNLPGLTDKMRQDKIIPDADYTAVVDSAKVGTIKPEPRIFELAQQLAAVEPKEILYIDDNRTNLVAADRIGWHVIWFDDFHPEESIQKIKQALEF